MVNTGPMQWRYHSFPRMGRPLCTFCMLVSFSLLQVKNLSVLALSMGNSRSSPYTTRSKFLSSTAATFLVSTAGVLAVDPESCAASSMSSSTNKNPRYIERTLEMKYAEDKSKLSCISISDLFYGFYYVIVLMRYDAYSMYVTHFQK